MRVPVVPECTIDWSRTFSLPAGVPPETLASAELVEYLTGSLVNGDIPLSSYDRFVSKGPNSSEVRRAPAGQATRYVVPRASTANTDAPAALPGAASNVVRGGAFSTAAPDPGTASQVAAKLESALPYDSLSRRFTPLPIPFQDLDTVRLYFAPQTIPPFNGTLGVDEPGLLGDGDLPTELPPLLLETRNTQLGEVDPLLLRSPVRGRFRFEPYLIYQWSGGTFTPVGPSNSGRLVIQQPSTPGDAGDTTDTQVRKERLFAIDHVDRESVAEIAHSVLMLQLAFLDGIVKSSQEADGAVAELAIPKNVGKALGWVLSSVNTLMRSWTAFLSILRWRSEDVTAASAIPAAWFGAFPSRELQLGDRDALVAAVGQLLQDDDCIESLTFYCKNVHAPRLAGLSWNEVLQKNGQDPNTKRFPVPSDQPPFSPKNADQIAQHQRLRLLEDPSFRWVGCYAGCPLGRPSKLYAPQGGAPSIEFPQGGLTTYEVEALHAAGTAATELGIGAVAAQGPQPGHAMDMSGYSGAELGNACTFTAERSGSDPLHTTADWLIELMGGIHFHLDEPPFLDLEPLMDPNSAAGNPVAQAVHFDMQMRAKNLRRQMDVVDDAGSTTTWLNWWKTHLNLTQDANGKWGDKSDPGPTRSFLKGATRPPKFDPDVLLFDDLELNETPSGFDKFDIESASLACLRMADPIGGQTQLPLSVLLTIMQTEGVKLFGPINRAVRNTTREAETLVWEYDRRTFADINNAGANPIDPVSNTTPPTDPPERARRGWMLFPYGLDHFAQPNTAAGVDGLVNQVHQAGVMTLDPNESIGQYFHDRVYSSFFAIPSLGFGPNVGVPRIWKRSRRAHWAGLALMAGFYRQLESQMRASPINSAFTDQQTGWTPKDGPTGWFPPGKSPPDLSGKTSTSTEWKDFITYYALVYLAFNAGPGGWTAHVQAAEPAAVASGLPLRDYLLFKNSRGSQIAAHLGRFAITLDAYLRLDYMTNEFPGAYSTASADTADPNGRNWGV